MKGQLNLCAFTIAMLASASVAAQELDQTPGDEFIINAWSDPTDCNHENARVVTFSDFTDGMGAGRGECVMVEGYWYGRALFQSFRDAKSRRSTTSERLRGKRVGLYAKWEEVGEPPDEPLRAKLVGRVGECETEWPSAMMVMGYCHYTGGAILLVSEVFPLSRVYAR